MASTAAWSTSSLSPLPMWRAAAMAAASVTRTSSIAMLRSMGAWVSPVVMVSPFGWAGVYVHADVQGLDGVGERADGNQIDAGFGDGGDVFEGDAAGGF